MSFAFPFTSTGSSTMSWWSFLRYRLAENKFSCLSLKKKIVVKTDLFSFTLPRNNSFTTSFPLYFFPILLQCHISKKNHTISSPYFLMSTFLIHKKKLHTRFHISSSVGLLSCLPAVAAIRLITSKVLQLIDMLQLLFVFAKK